jgi:hypothetical protein
MPRTIVDRYVGAVGMFRNLFERLTRLSRRARSVGAQSVAEHQHRVAALRLAASGRTTAPD